MAIDGHVSFTLSPRQLSVETPHHEKSQLLKSDSYDDRKPIPILLVVRYLSPCDFRVERLEGTLSSTKSSNSAKNGVYTTLVKDVKNALLPLKEELVPCVLLSFADEQILVWRGKDWKSMCPEGPAIPQNFDTAGGLDVSGSGDQEFPPIPAVTNDESLHLHVKRVGGLMIGPENESLHLHRNLKRGKGLNSLATFHSLLC
ncbi:hypothetical protein Q3G72_004008 [Acer saccharum]|nr:hypothetical protein Q3G72_004008 [Acer saccharum]